MPAKPTRPLRADAHRGSIRAAMSQDLLLEIGVEELPASFVAQAVAALPELMTKALAQLRLTHGRVWSSGTPRRLALMVDAVAEAQPDLDEQVMGPPSRAAFDAKGNPTKAAEAFATKLGIALDAITRVDTPKGEYIAGQKKEKGAPALQMLPQALAQICGKIPFRKSMRWGSGDVAFGRPVRWLVALFGGDVITFQFAGLTSGRTSQGHRFLAPAPFELKSPGEYRSALAARHVVVDIGERKRVMVERLVAKAESIGGKLIEDAFLVEENSSLVEDPKIVLGHFEQAFLALPEQVILNVARTHQRYFCVHDQSGRLMPRYLAVAGTAEKPEFVQRGNDRVMRARLSDARFFHTTDLAHPLGARTAKLDEVTFHKRLGSIGDKVRRIDKLVETLGAELKLDMTVIETAKQGAALAKCDLVTLMVGEIPELQGDVGRTYALTQGISAAVANVISEHYQPKGADDPTAPSAAGALVAIADRVDTLVGCFAIGQVPSGTSDPLALRRATLGVLRTLLDHGWDLSLGTAIRSAYAGYAGVKLDQSADDTVEKLLAFFRDRLRGLLPQPVDVVDACLAADTDRPLDASLRAAALAQIEPELRATVGEVFKRAANIARDAKEGEPVAPAALGGDVHPSEQRLFGAIATLKQKLQAARATGAYPAALGAIAEFAPVLAQYFVDVYVMAEDLAIRDNRLKLMRDIHRTCSTLANFDLLANRKVV
jgi:glycyl-tRNA synthetase beta chain